MNIRSKLALNISPLGKASYFSFPAWKIVGNVSLRASPFCNLSLAGSTNHLFGVYPHIYFHTVHRSLISSALSNIFVNCWLVQKLLRKGGGKDIYVAIYVVF